RLRDLFAQSGIATSSGVLAVLIGANAVEAAPAGLALTISAAAVAGAAGTTSATIVTAKLILMSILQKSLIASAVLAAVAAGVYQTQKHVRARQPLVAAQQARLPAAQSSPPSLQASNTVAALAANRSSPRPPAAPKSAGASLGAKGPSTAPGGFQSTEMYALLASKKNRLTAAQAAPYLAANGRSATSLLAAFRTTGNGALLAEALQKYSDNPQVGFEAAIRNDAS